MNLLSKTFNLFRVSSDVDLSADVSFKMAFTNVVNFCLLVQSLLMGIYSLLIENALLSTLNMTFSLFFTSYFVITYVLRNHTVVETIDRIAIFFYFIVIYVSCVALHVLGVQIMLYPFIALILHGRHVGAALSFGQLVFMTCGYLVALQVLGGDSPYIYSISEAITFVLLQLMAIFVYYVAIRWLSTMIYDKNHEIKMLQDEMLVKQDLVRRLTHDVAQPIEEITEASQILSSERLNPLQAELVGLINTAARKAHDNVRSVLKADEADIPVIPTDVVRFDVFALVTAVMKVFKPRDNSKRHEFTSANNVPKILLADREMLRRVLLDVLDALNSKVGLADSALHIHISRDEMTDSKDIELLFQVSVSGGLSIDKRDISNPELRLLDDLDLEVTRRIVEADWCTLSVNMTDDGLRVNFSYICQDGSRHMDMAPETISLAKVAMETPTPVAQGSILFVSDDDLLWAAARQALDPMVGRLVRARDVKEAVSCFTDALYGLVLADVKSDKEFGAKLVEKLRGVECGVARHIPMVAFVESDEPQVLIDCMACGFDSHLLLPFDAEVTRAHVCSYFV